MFSETLWIPGKRRLTNAMLSDLRAAGYWAAKREGLWSSRRRLSAAADRFAEETRTIRKLVADEAMRLGLRRRIGKVVLRASILVTGHPHHDPDAWYLVAKAAVDGLVDALAISSDRKQIDFIGGRVVGVAEPGFYLKLTEVTRQESLEELCESS